MSIKLLKRDLAGVFAYKKPPSKNGISADCLKMRKRDLDAIEDIATEFSKIANTFNLPERAPLP